MLDFCCQILSSIGKALWFERHTLLRPRNSELGLCVPGRLQAELHPNLFSAGAEQRQLSHFIVNGKTESQKGPHVATAVAVKKGKF